MTSNRTRHALLMSITSILVCIAMLIGSTFAWFTDTAETEVSSIVSGTFDVELVKPDKEGDKYVTLDSNPLKWVTNDSRDQSNIYWEPGASYDLESFRIKNNGNLALKYKVIISGIVGNAELLNAIDFKVTVSNGDALVAKDGTSTVSTVATLNNFEGTLAAGAVTGKITITGTMKDTAGNEYQGKTITGIGITVIATQNTVEKDTTDETYDVNAQYPVYTVKDVTSNTNTSNGVTKVTNTVTIETAEKVSTDGTEVPAATAEIPADVVLEPGVTQLKFVIEDNKVNSNFAVEVDSSTQAKKTLEIKLDGVSPDNTVANKITFYIEPNLAYLKLYHNNNDMNKKDSESALKDDQDYYYNSTTGQITMLTAKFSPFTYVYTMPLTVTVTTSSELAEALENDAVKVINVQDINIDNNSAFKNIITAPVGKTINILSGTFNHSGSKCVTFFADGGTINISNCYVKYANSWYFNVANGGKIVVTGGDFVSSQTGIVRNDEGKGEGKIIIKGGIFDRKKVSDYLADGYVIQEGKSKYRFTKGADGQWNVPATVYEVVPTTTE